MSTRLKLTSLTLASVFAIVGATTPIVANAEEAWRPDVRSIESNGFEVDYTEGNELLFVEDVRSPAASGIYSRFLSATGTIQESIELCSDLGPNLDCSKVYVDPNAPGADATEEEISEYSPPTAPAVAVGGKALLPYCGTIIESCIENLELKDPETGEFVSATYVGTTSGTYFTGNPSLGVPSGVGPAIFRSPVAHTGGDEYTLKASLDFFYQKDAPVGRDNLEAREFILEAFATKRELGDYRASFSDVCRDTVDNKAVTACGGGNAFGECVYSDSGVCGREHYMTEEQVLRVSLILTNQLTGWFKGRLKDPRIDVQPIDENYSRVVISGESVEVPRFLATFSLAKGDPDIVGPLEDNGHGGPFTLFNAASPRAMEIVKGMRERVNDTAAGTSTIWSIGSISARRAASNGQQGTEACLADKSRLLGIVTTNSMTYLGTAPTFDSGYLSYKVAGLHYAPDGETVNEGTYDLVMRTDTARCLYGFKNAPISATVAVVGAQGEEKVATTVVSEKDGWLKLAAYGFTFSEKEIQVQLRQSQLKTLKAFSGSRTSLTSSQKAEIRAVLAKSDGNTKFICTGIRYFEQPMSVNIMVRKRAKEACEYAKSINPNFSYWYQTKPTKARSYAGKVFIVSKG